MLCPIEYVEYALDAINEGNERSAREYVMEAARHLSPKRIRELLGDKADRLLPIRDK